MRNSYCCCEGLHRRCKFLIRHFDDLKSVASEPWSKWHCSWNVLVRICMRNRRGEWFCFMGCLKGIRVILLFAWLRSVQCLRHWKFRCKRLVSLRFKLSSFYLAFISFHVGSLFLEYVASPVLTEVLSGILNQYPLFKTFTDNHHTEEHQYNEGDFIVRYIKVLCFHLFLYFLARYTPIVYKILRSFPAYALNL